jgi:hypothetical protein
LSPSPEGAIDAAGKMEDESASEFDEALEVAFEELVSGVSR